MPHEYEIEFSEPSASTCECCGGLTVRVTRFVHRDGGSFAVYFAAYSNNHADNELAMLISLGEWGEGSDAKQRAAFYCRVRSTDESYQVTLGDAALSLWGHADIVGKKLSREEALCHPWKATAFEVLDEAFLRDPSLRGFLDRVKCGSAAVPLARSFRMPDDVFALGDERESRAELGRNFASLDGKRFFVRCLLPIPVENYGSWCVGLWVEVRRSDYDRVLDAWDDTEKYPKLRFSGNVRNDITTDLDIPVPGGTLVDVHVTDPDTPPRIAPSPEGALAVLLTKEWSKSEFVQYAVARGFL